jgi:hypothetical protein
MMITACFKGKPPEFTWRRRGKSEEKKQAVVVLEVNLKQILPFSVFLNLGRTTLTMYQYIAIPYLDGTPQTIHEPRRTTLH